MAGKQRISLCTPRKDKINSKYDWHTNECISIYCYEYAQEDRNTNCNIEKELQEAQVLLQKKKIDSSRAYLFYRIKERNRYVWDIYGKILPRWYFKI